MAEKTRAALRDPLGDVLEQGGIAASFRLLTTGDLNQAILDGYAERVLVAPRTAPPLDRLLDGFEAAIQVAVSVDSNHEVAVERFRSSRIYSHLMSLSDSTMQGRLADDLEDRNLVGTPDAVCEKVSRYAEAGVCTLAGLLFATDTVEATLDAMAMFAEEVVDSWTP